MAKPLPPITQAHPSLISWHVSLGGDEFDVEGVTLADALKLFGEWNSKRAGSGLTPAQLTDLLARAERLASRLEGLDSDTP
jgi:hypothetical protein